MAPQHKVVCGLRQCASLPSVTKHLYNLVFALLKRPRTPAMMGESG